MVRAAGLAAVLFLVLAGCLLGAAGTLDWPMAWGFLGIYALSKLSGFIFADSEMIKERAAPGPVVDRVDRMLAAIGYLGLYPGTLVVAGFDAVRFGPCVQIPHFLQLGSLLVFALGYGIATWAVFSNPFFSTFVLIQRDRDHSVVSSGPYAVVRHPGYAGVLLSHLALPIALGSLWALLPAVLGVIFFVRRTSREDRTLQDQLPGYSAYQTRVRWRLVPGVW